jgi:hypothetical protein
LERFLCRRADGESWGNKLRDADTYNKMMMMDARNVKTTALKKLQHQSRPPLASFDPLEIARRLINQLKPAKKSTRYQIKASGKRTSEANIYHLREAANPSKHY